MSELSRATSITPIKTYWNGCVFRSRLEARWAVVMDALGIGFRYEAEGYELPGGLRYLPDFFIPSWDAFLEIKPLLPDRREIRKAVGLAWTARRQVFMLIGEARMGAYDAWVWTPDTFASFWSGGFQWTACRDCGPRLTASGLCACRAKDDVTALWDAFDQAAAVRFEFRHDHR